MDGKEEERGGKEGGGGERESERESQPRPSSQVFPKHAQRLKEQEVETRCPGRAS